MVSILIIILFGINIAINNKILSYKNLRNNKVTRDLQNESSKGNIYNITIYNYFFQDKYILLYTYSGPQLPYNITFMMTIYITKYNDSLGYWISKEMDVRAYCLDDPDYIYYAYVEDLTLENFEVEINLTILNITTESPNNNDTIYVDFEQIIFNFPEIYDTDNGTEPAVFVPETDYSDNSDSAIIPDNPDSSESFETPLISNRRSNSSGSSTIWIILGSIGGVGIVAGAIIIYLNCFNKKDDKKK